MANQTLEQLENTGLYSKDLIDSLKSKNFSAIKNLSSEQRSNSKYMYPLLWAVKEEMGTFAVFSHMSEDLQSDTYIASEVIKSEPELFAESPLSGNRSFILAHIQSIPNLSNYMNAALKTDLSFIKTLCEASSPDVAKQILNNVNIEDPSILDDVPSYTEAAVDAVIVAAVVSNPENLLDLSEEQKNDYATLKEAARQNDKVIDFVVDHMEEFGSDGLRGIRESSEDAVIESYTEAIKNSENTGGILNIDKVVDLEHPDKVTDPGAVAKLLAIGYLTDNIDEDLARKAVNVAALTMQRAKDDPEWLKNDPEAYKAVFDPNILDKCLQILEQGEVELSPQVKELLEGYRDFHSSFERPDFRTQEEIDQDDLADRLQADADAAGMTLEEYMKANGIEPPPLEDPHESQEIPSVEPPIEPTQEPTVEASIEPASMEPKNESQIAEESLVTVKSAITSAIKIGVSEDDISKVDNSNNRDKSVQIEEEEM